MKLIVHNYKEFVYGNILFQHPWSRLEPQSQRAKQQIYPNIVRFKFHMYGL